MMDVQPSTLKMLLAIVCFCGAVASSLHAIVRRRDPHAALWWVAVSLTLPMAGPILYYFFGINRIERRAVRLRRRTPSRTNSPHLILAETIDENAISYDLRHLLSVCKISEKAVNMPLTRGNNIQPLFNGDEAFPEMLSAIDKAEKSVGLSTYIFEKDQVGQLFIEALERAMKRGVQVRVLIDDVGSGFMWRSVYKELVARKVPTDYFMPTLVPWRVSYFNLRSHRKILTIDGTKAFTGGMNITATHSIKSAPSSPAEDVHFEVDGPVVAQIQETFRSDWFFTTGELLSGKAWFPDLYEQGLTFARGIPDGPDEDFERTKLIILGALAHAKRSVKVMTPYLIPDASLISALNVAAMAGVEVDVVLPEVSDMTVVGWATQAYLWQLLERGVRVHRTPKPFNHAKLMVVDGGWTLFGSTNWDRRSLRLNFEFNVECYGRELADRMEKFIDGRIKSGRHITLKEMDSRPILIKIRDGIARLFSPML